jgi:hypothetical protein
MDRGYAWAGINLHVWSGLHPAKDIERIVLNDYFRGEDLTKAEKTWVSEELERAWSAKLEEEKSWPAVTDWDRLDAAFARLEVGGIMAMHNAGVEYSDCSSMVATEYHVRGAMKSRIVGYCLYQRKDIEKAIGIDPPCAIGMDPAILRKKPSRDGVELHFGDIDGDLKKGVEIGRRVAAAVEEAGLRTSWNGTINKRILVHMRWQKRYRPTLQEAAAAMTAGSWESFTVALGQDLAGMWADDTRVFDYGARYVQVAAGPSGISLEVVSNLHLPPDQFLTTDEEESLRRLGWGEPEWARSQLVVRTSTRRLKLHQRTALRARPATALPQPPSRPRPPRRLNWHRKYPWPLSSSQAAEAAQVLTDAIRAILPAPSPADLKIDAFKVGHVDRNDGAPT